MNGLLEAPKPVEEHQSYEEAVRSLNQLQSNDAVLDDNRAKQNKGTNDKIHKMLVYLQRVGIQLDDVNKLNVMHITGTKGKGSTGAFCERILRAHGYKTGFYSSPHLIEVRERIRINGKPISPDAFRNYYWQCHELLLRGADGNAAEMPAYFAFLTAMAFKIFVEERVDAAIVEVGIGGRFDCTNIVSYPVACGVTSLGLDHVSILGDTVEKIAWQKGGIFKAGAAAITVPDQPGDSENVLRQCANEVGVQLQIAPPLDQICGRVPSLSLEGRVQQINAALAVQLALSWLHAVAGRRQSHALLSSVESCGMGSPATISPTFQWSRNELYMSPKFLEGLQTCRWPGRNQVVRRGRVTYYVDGAHTAESIRQCAEWFDERSNDDWLPTDGSRVRVLLFNLKGDRSAATLLEPLLRIGFGAVAFCPNLVAETGNSVDQTSHFVTPDMQLKKSNEIRSVWIELSRLQLSCGRSRSERATTGDDCVGCDRKASRPSTISRVPFREPQRSPDQYSDFADDRVTLSLRASPNVSDTQSEDPDASAFHFPCIEAAIHWISSTMRDEVGDVGAFCSSASSVQARLRSASHVQVLVTGSLHLVGGVLAALKHRVD